MNWTDHANFAITLFALINPFTKIPFVVASAERDGEGAVLTLALTSTLTAAAVLLIAYYLGDAALQILGTSLPSFEIGGGIVILLTGLHMLSDQGVESAMNARPQAGEDLRYVKIGVSPLGIPMLAGSAAISRVIIESHQGTSIEWDRHIAMFIILVSVAAGLVIAASSLLLRLLGRTFFAVLARIAGLIIVAIGVELVMKGISAHVHAF